MFPIMHNIVNSNLGTLCAVMSWGYEADTIPEMQHSD